MIFEYNCYVVLDVPFDSDIATIKNAYRTQSKKAHPDLGGSDDAQKRVNLAYEQLADPVLRSKHDKEWRIRTPAFFRRKDFRAEEEPKKTTEKKMPGEAPTGRSNQQRETRARTQYRSNKPSRSENAYQDEISRNVASTIASTREKTLAAEMEKYAIYRENFLETRERERRFRIRGALFFVGGGIVSVVMQNIIPVLVGLLGLSVFVGGKTRSIDGFNYLPSDAKPENVSRLTNSYIEHRVDREIRGMAATWERLRPLFNNDNFAFSKTSSEKTMAIQLLLGFFSIGYVPVAFYGFDRTLTFEDDGGVVIVRFRHRDGAPTNISYVRDLCTKVRARSQLYGGEVKKVYVFASPGFSDNAMEECRRFGIRYYNYDDFQEWLAGLRESRFSGPHSDVFNALGKFSKVIDQIRYARIGR